MSPSITFFASSFSQTEESDSNDCLVMSQLFSISFKCLCTMTANANDSRNLGLADFVDSEKTAQGFPGLGFLLIKRFEIPDFDPETEAGFLQAWALSPKELRAAVFSMSAPLHPKLSRVADAD